jgi:hypothetical protein
MRQLRTLALCPERGGLGLVIESYDPTLRKLILS